MKSTCFWPQQCLWLIQRKIELWITGLLIIWYQLQCFPNYLLEIDTFISYDIFILAITNIKDQTMDFSKYNLLSIISEINSKERWFLIKTWWLTKVSCFGTVDWHSDSISHQKDIVLDSSFTFYAIAPQDSYSILLFTQEVLQNMNI